MYKNKLLKRIFAVLLSAAITVPVISCSCISASATINLYDSWYVSDVKTESSCLPYYVQRAFDEAMQNYNGFPLTPIAYYGIQVVAGYNYDLICQEQTGNGNISLKKVIVYDPNPIGSNVQKTARISYIENFDLEDYEYNNSYTLPEYPVCGGTEIPSDISGCGLPDNVQKVYDKFFELYDGWGCMPVAFLGEKHTDKGTDYAVLGKTYAVVPDPDKFVDVVMFHENDNGEVYIKSTYSLLGEKGRYVTELENDSNLSTDIIRIGNTLNVYGYAQGGDGNYTYAVLYKKKSDKKWTVKQNYSTNDIIAIKPAKATDYDVCVKVKDGTGKIVKRFFEIHVNEKLKNTSDISETVIRKGNTVTVKGSATGGIGAYEYAVLYKKASESEWTVRQGYKENNEILVRPYTNTNYDICIKVRDIEGTVSKKYFSVTVR